MMIYQKSALGALYVLALAACSQAQNPSAPPDSQVKPAANCAPIDGIDSLLDAGNPEIIIIGEIHGMTGPPALTEALVCRSLAAGFKTALALELPDNDDLLSKYLSSRGAPDDQAALFQEPMWTSDVTDGRSSEAMLDLIDYARRTSQADQNLKVFGFQATGIDYANYPNRSAASQAYEARMAQNILSGAQKFEAEKTIVLVGNMHAKRNQHIMNRDTGEGYDLMAVHMPAPQTITLENIFTSGDAWNCLGTPAGELECAAHDIYGAVNPDDELGASPDFKIILAGDGDAAGLSLDNFIKPGEYDGVAYIGTAKASPPANAAGRKPDKPQKAQ